MHSASEAADLTRALAALDQAKRQRWSSTRAIPAPRIKPLVLAAEPRAAVRRTATRQFMCFIGDEHIRSQTCGGMHATPNGAWICLARYLRAQHEQQQRAKEAGQ